jgi:hypothetical protein
MSNYSTTDIGCVIRFCLLAKIDHDFPTQAAGLENDTRSDKWECRAACIAPSKAKGLNKSPRHRTS